MSEVTVGRWGKSLAIRLPSDIARALGVEDGERVEVEHQNGDIVIRRTASRAKAAAQEAVEEIIAEAEHYSLGGISISELINEDRR
jgi:antitoxin component of MazEF toxin-antitoxin module